MTDWHTVRLVALREMRERFRTREFRASTVIQALIVVAIVVVIGIISGDETDSYEVATVGAEAEAIAAAATEQQAALDIELDLVRSDSEAAARASIADDDLEAAIAADRLITGTNPPDTLVALLQAATRNVRGAERLREAGVPDSGIREALDPPPLVVSEVGDGGGGEGLAFLSSLLLFGALMGFGFYLATGVVQEKSSRVVELLLAAIRPAQLLAGKVLGIGALGLGQLLVIAVAGVGAALALGTVGLPDTTGSTLALVGVFFILGYLLYGCAFAVAGAIVSRAEDAQSTTGPLTLILVVGYVAAASLLGDPGSPVAVICTFIPATAPMVVPMRAAQDAIPAWEIAASAALVLIAAAAMIWLAARIYERAVLHMGAPLKLAQALRLAR